MVELANDMTFSEKVLSAEGLTLVDFWAPWCGPCRMIAPVLEEIAEQYDGKLRVVKVNVDESPITAAQFGIQSIPTLYFIRDGRPIGRLVGLQSRNALATAIDELLAATR